MPADDLAADMYEMTQELCAAAGKLPYEVSNYAETGSESRHNLIYWRYGDYAGIGPGAHARLTLGGHRFAIENWRNPTKWLETAEAGSGESLREGIDREGQATELLLMGLRLSEGVDMARYEALAGRPITGPRVTHLQELGLVSIENQRLSVPPAGRMVLNSVIAELLVE